MSYVGKRVPRVDAPDKAAGRAKYTADLCGKSALVAKVLHAPHAHALVKSINTEAALKVEGVEAVFTCFDVPKNYFPTAGHPWSTDIDHQDIADRLLLTDHVRFWGDDVAVVVATDELAAKKALREIEVEYEELPFVLDVQEAMREGAPQLHEGFEHNVLGHSSIRMGNYAEAIKEPGLIKVEGWYDTPTVQHCHIENHNCWAYMENGRVVVVATDLGFVSEEVRSALAGCDVAVMESNHDVGMLQSGGYPYYLKRRILSPQGHLSNSACAQELPDLVRQGTTRILLAHLSRENNIPQLAYQTALCSLLEQGMKAGEDFLLQVSPVENSGGHTLLI